MDFVVFFFFLSISLFSVSCWLMLDAALQEEIAYKMEKKQKRKKT